MMEVFPDGQKITDGFKKYQQILTLLPNDMLVSKLGEKKDLLVSTTDSRTFDKTHYEVLLLTNELEERNLI